jgi:hypothetical protein
MNTQKTQQQKSKPSIQKIVNLSEGVLITGMHRSGTSMIAGLVEKMGVNQLGKNPMPAAADNRDGFYEDVVLAGISDEIMGVFDATWDVPTVGPKSDIQKRNLTESIIKKARNDVFQMRQDVGEPWFIKDPRICLTLSEWKRILLFRTPVIFIVRNPHDVASSLMQRNDMGLRRALAIWHRYNTVLIHSVKSDQILVIDYDSTCIKPGAAQEGIQTFLEGVLTMSNNTSFKVENQVLFNPRVFSKSTEIDDTHLSKESKDCFDLYRKLRQFHLKTNINNLSLITEPKWVAEELELAQLESITQKKLTELNTKAEYLYTELETSRNLASGQEAQLTELNTKAEYLYTELETSREIITERNVEIYQINRKVQNYDRELTRLSITLAEQEFRTRDFQELVLRKEILSEAVLLLVEDLRRLTLRRNFRLIRSLKLFLSKTVFRKSDGCFKKNNILPMQIDGQKYLREIIESELRISQYLELNPDIAMSGINPFTHFILHGRLEGRACQKINEANVAAPRRQIWT